MKQYDIKGVVTRHLAPTLQFSITINANDQASAKRLIELQYGFGGAKVNIQKIQEVKPKK